MLPPTLVSTYQQYKQDTDSIAAWLASTAKTLGFSSGFSSTATTSAGTSKPSSSGRLKGKARAQAKKQAASSAKATSTSTSTSTSGQSALPAKPKYIINIKDFIPLAEYVAAKTFPVPNTFTATIDRVISVRSAFSSKLEEHGEASNEASDAKHQYFVGVLEKVREVLKPLASRKDDAQSSSAAASNLSNQFAGLAVYEPSQEFLDAPDIERPAKSQDDNVIYEAESMSTFEDAIFALTALINDMNRIRAHIKWIWSNYKIGVFDLVAAAITTNTAIDLVRDMMGDILPLLKEHGGVGDMLQRFYVFQCVIKGWDPDDILVSGKDNFNYKTYDIANGTYFMAYRLLGSFANVLQPGLLPLYKEGAYGYYDPASDRSRKTGKEKFQDDLALLMPFFTELMTITREAKQHWPVRDEFLRGMEELDRTREIPFYLVFAAQIFLDITYELGQSIQNPFRTFVDHTTVMDNDIKSHFDFHADLKISHWPESNNRWMRDLQDRIKWVGGDPLRVFQNKVLQHQGVAPPNTESHRLFRMSPVISGLMLYYFRSRYHDVGFAVANAWGSIQSCGHLYNALQHEKLLEGTWGDMDIAYANLGEASFYVGGEEPRTPDDYFKKFCLQMGTSAAAMSKSRRKNTPLASKAGPRGLKETSPVLSMFKGRYVDNSDRVDLTPEDVDQIIELSLFENEGEGGEGGAFSLAQIEDPEKLKKKKGLQQGSRRRPHKKATDGGHMSPEQLIKPLLFALHAETMDFVFPYLNMHRWCWRVLRTVKDSCDSVLRQLYTSAYIQRETELPFVVAWIFMAASPMDGGFSDRRPLKKAAEALDGLIQSGAGNFIVTQVLGKRFSMPVEFRSS